MPKESKPKTPSAKTAPAKTLLLKQDGAVLWVRLNRPDAKNGIDETMRGELIEQLKAADADKGVRCIVITGEGKVFCSGADLSSAPSPVTDDSLMMEYRGLTDGYRELFKTYWELRTPVVSAVNGTVAGVGWMLALLADMVVAAEGARWIHVFASRGMAPHAGDPYFLRRVLPFHALNEIYMMRERYISEDMQKWGCINRLVAADALEATAKEIADRLASGPTKSMGEAKQLYRSALDANMLAAFKDEDSSLALLSETHDRKEGVDSLMEGREPDFKGS